MGSRDHHASADDKIRSRYDELRVLRETQPEREAAACREAMHKSRQAAETLIVSLKEQLAAAQQAQAPAAVQESEALAALRTENEQLRRQLAASQATASSPPSASSDALKARVSFYELITGMQVQLSGEVATCTVSCEAPGGDDDAPPTPAAKSPRATSGATRPPRTAVFELNLNPADGEPGLDVEYVPTDLSGCADAELPEYLRESIVFERAQAPGFLQRLLAGVASD